MKPQHPASTPPVPFASITMTLIGGKRVDGYYMRGSPWWRDGYRADDGSPVLEAKIRTWEYLTEQESDK